MAQAHHSVDRALAGIMKLHTRFEAEHQEHAAYLVLVAKSLMKTQEMMLAFWRNTWGKLPDNIESYRIK